MCFRFKSKMSNLMILRKQKWITKQNEFVLLWSVPLTSSSLRMPLCPQVSRSSRAWDQKFSSWSGSVPSCPTVNLKERSKVSQSERRTSWWFHTHTHTQEGWWRTGHAGETSVRTCAVTTYTSFRCMCQWGGVKGHQVKGFWTGLCWGWKVKGQWGTCCQRLDRWADYRLCR